MALREEILDKYISYVLQYGLVPSEVNEFCLKTGLSAEEFQTVFNSLDSLLEDIWLRFFNEGFEAFEKDESSKNLSVSEKWLSFLRYYFDTIRSYRGFLIIIMNQDVMGLSANPKGILGMKISFMNFVNQLIDEGKSSQQVAERPELAESYDQLFWLQLLFILNFWSKDYSVGFKNTDEAIQMSTELIFALIERNVFDSAIEFGKFLFSQN